MAERENMSWFDNFVVKTPTDKQQIVMQIEVTNLLPWHTGEHPFDVEDDDEMEDLKEKIQRDGILNPLLVRREKNLDGRFEVISGHRRLHCAKELGIQFIPAIVLEYDDDKATIAMVESNVGLREHIKPSNLAKAYKMYLDANKRRAGRPKNEDENNSDTECPNLWTTDEAAAKFKKSSSTIKLYVRLNNLVPGLMDIVDNGKIPLKAGAELSYLTPEKQQAIVDKIEQGYKMDQAEANRLRKLSDEEFQSEMQGAPKETAVIMPKKEKKPKLNETYINKYLTEDIKKRTVEEKQQYVKQALIHYNNYLEEHPEEKNAWETADSEK